MPYDVLSDGLFPLSLPTDPFRLRVQKSLTEAFKQIQIANGFSVDVSDVQRGRVYFGEETPLPFISILEDPIAADGSFSASAGDSALTDYELMVQGFVKDEAANPTDNAHFLMADVKKRLIQLRSDEQHPDLIFRFGPKANTVVEIRFDAGVARPADEISATAYFWLRVRLVLAEDLDEPLK